MAVRAAAVVVMVVTGGAAVAAPARAAGTAGYCADGSGVTVVVDFNELGGGVVVRCAPGDQTTGLSALKNAGFTIAGTSRWGEAFVCRIEGRPAVDTEPCVDTPPATAYWSYWYASNGGSWTYSDKGVRNRKPPPGSFEGWSFSTGRSAATAPRPDAAPNRPAPPPPPTTGGGANQPGGGARATTQPGGGAGNQPGAGAEPGAGSQPGAGATEPGAAQSGTRPPMGDPSSAITPDLQPGSRTGVEVGPDGASPETTGSSGTPTGTLAGVGVLLALVIAAGFTVRRRRRSGEPADPFAEEP